MMKVTSVTLTIPKKQNPGNPFKAWAKIMLDDILMISGLMLFEHLREGKIVRTFLFPDREIPFSQTGGERIRSPIVNSNDKELREEITSAIFAEYDQHPRNQASKKNKIPTPVEE